MRRAFRDRAEYLGDPDFVQVPVTPLLERTYLDRAHARLLAGSRDAERCAPRHRCSPGMNPPRRRTIPWSIQRATRWA